MMTRMQGAYYMIVQARDFLDAAAAAFVCCAHENAAGPYVIQKPPARNAALEARSLTAMFPLLASQPIAYPFPRVESWFPEQV